MRTICCFMAVMLTTIGVQRVHAAEVVDAVVATVDQEVILYSDLLREVQSGITDLRRTAGTQDQFDREAQQLLRETLDQAVERKILVRQAQLLGVEVSDDEVEAQVDRLRDLYPTTEAFMKELERTGETLGEVRDQIRKTRLALKMSSSKRRQLERDVVVTEEDVTQYYEEHRDEFEHPERVRVRQIFLKAGDDPAEQERARARLEVIKEELRAGANFADLARAHSEAPGAENGGLMGLNNGWQERGELVESLEKAVFALEEGEVSQILPSPGGLNLFYVDEREEAGVASLAEVRTQIEPRIRAELAEERYRVWMEELRRKSRVRIFL